MQNLHTTAMDGGSVENVGTIFNHYIRVENSINRMFQDGHDCMDAEGRATHDYRDIGGRVTPGAVTEETESRKPKPNTFSR